MMVGNEDCMFYASKFFLILSEKNRTEETFQQYDPHGNSTLHTHVAPLHNLKSITSLEQLNKKHLCKKMENQGFQKPVTVFNLKASVQF